jgi:hypothetical protein
MNLADLDLYDDNHSGNGVGHLTIKVEFNMFSFFFTYQIILLQGPPLADLLNICPQPPYIKNMEDIPTNTCVFMIKVDRYIYISLNYIKSYSISHLNLIH